MFQMKASKAFETRELTLNVSECVCNRKKKKKNVFVVATRELYILLNG